MWLLCRLPLVLGAEHTAGCDMVAHSIPSAVVRLRTRCLLQLCIAEVC